MPRLLNQAATSTPSPPTLQVLFPPPGERMTDVPLAFSGGARYSSIDGLWMLVTALGRSLPCLKSSSLSEPGPALSAGWPGGKSVTTLWPATSGLGSTSFVAGGKAADDGVVAGASAALVTVVEHASKRAGRRK